MLGLIGIKADDDDVVDISISTSVGGRIGIANAQGFYGGIGPGTSKKAAEEAQAVYGGVTADLTISAGPIGFTHSESIAGSTTKSNSVGRENKEAFPGAPSVKSGVQMSGGLTAHVGTSLQGIMNSLRSFFGPDEDNSPSTSPGTKSDSKDGSKENSQSAESD